MDTQPGTRTNLVDPFGRELEEWLRDAPTTRAPYVSDLVMPPVTGPIRRPVPADETPADDVQVDAPAVDAPTDDAPAHDASAEVVATDDSSFRRDRGRHATVCAPSFPDPPERLALRFGDLAVEVSAASGRSTVERIDLFESELRRRDEDLARLAAWEARVDDDTDPEVAAARAFAADAFADILADALAEATELERRARVRHATTILQSDPVRAPHAPDADAEAIARSTDPVLVLPAPKPTPLVLPATGPNAIHRAAFEEAIRTHSGHTAEVPVIFPLTPIAATADVAHDADAATADAATADVATADVARETAARPSWWARLVTRLLHVLARR